MPRVTVAIPVRNGKRFLPQTLASLQQQTFRDFEILILDDGSSDNSVDMLTKRQWNIPMRIIQNSKPQGLVSARNQLIKEARGEYLAWIDQDDLAFPKRLETQVRYLETFKDTLMVGSYSIFFESERHAIPRGPQVLALKRYPTQHEAIACRLAFENCFDCSTVMQRLGTLNGEDFLQEDGLALDYGLWTRLSRKGRLANIPNFLGAWRVHQTQGSKGTGSLEIEKVSLQLSMNYLAEAFGESCTFRKGRLISCIRFSLPNVTRDDLTSTIDFLRTLVLMNCANAYFSRAEWRTEIDFQLLRLTALYQKEFDISLMMNALSQGAYRALPPFLVQRLVRFFGQRRLVSRYSRWYQQLPHTSNNQGSDSREELMRGAGMQL